MYQCATVLSKIQPATYREWEKACWDDLCCADKFCRTIDMDLALRCLIADGHVTQRVNLCQLSGSLEEVLSHIETRAREAQSEHQREEEERKTKLREWLNAASGETLTNTLLCILEDDRQDRDGYLPWENLEDMILHINEWSEIPCPAYS